MGFFIKLHISNLKACLLVLVYIFLTFLKCLLNYKIMVIINGNYCYLVKLKIGNP